MIKGIDISHWQGNINFNEVESKNDIDFVIIKATEGNGLTDQKFIKNQSSIRNTRLLCGYYHFARPDINNNPETEANYFLSIIGELNNGEILALDYECTNQKQSDVTWCKKFLDIVFSKTNIHPFIYLNQTQIKNFDWSEIINGNYALWVAAYTYDPNKNNFSIGEFPSVAIQQFSNKETILGISGNVDGNVFFGTLDTLKKYGYKKIEVSTLDNNSLEIDTQKALELLQSYKVSENHGNLQGAINDLIGKAKDLKISNAKIIELETELVKLSTEGGVNSNLLFVCQSDLDTANKNNDTVKETNDVIVKNDIQEEISNIIKNIISFIKKLFIK